MKTFFLTYLGLLLVGIGIFTFSHPDPDFGQIFGIPLLIVGSIFFIENLKRGIAHAVAEKIEKDGYPDEYFYKLKEEITKLIVDELER